MNNFLRIKRNRRAAPLRLAARIISIIILAFLWPARGGAEGSTITDLNVSSISGKLTLTYKQKSGSTTDYAWHYKAGEGNETEFSGKLTGTNNSWSHGAIDIKSEKTLSDEEDYPALKLNALNLTSTTDNGSLFNMVESGKPLYIQATGESSSNLKAKGDVIKNSNGCILFLDGGTVGLNIAGEGNNSCGIYLYYNSSSLVSATLIDKITVTAGGIAVYVGNSATLSAATDAKVMVSSENGFAIYEEVVKKVESPFLQWKFATAPANGQTLEIKNANGESFSPAIQFTTDGKKKSFAINVTKDTGYTLWLGNEQLMDAKGTSVFTATGNKLFTFSGMKKCPDKWTDYGQYANVGPEGTDVTVTVSGTSYTVNTPRGLAWIAWVTNNGKTSANTSETYPASAGFAGCTVTLAENISLVKPTQGVANDFDDNWIPIGIVSTSDLNNVYTKCFQGTFDGNNKNITEMKINTTSVINTGLFGYLYGATVKDLTMAESNSIHLQTLPSSETDYPLGSIAGYVENGIIMNCHNKCEVKFSNSDSDKDGKVGGIAGTIKNSVLSACSNSGGITINGSTAMGGGIVGVSTKSSIASCFNTGKIDVTAGSGVAYAGGIMGGDGSSDTGNNILHCYSTGNITAKATQSCPSGGIVGGAQYVTIKSCFATGSVSAESSSSDNGAYAGGIIGGIWSNSNVTVKDCLALNTGGVKATGNTSGKLAGRIVGKDNNATLSNNYASTKIQLTVGDNTSAPTADIAADAINGADTFLDEVADEIADWAGSEDTKAFSAIGTDTGGKLPQLKQIVSFGDDGLPTQYGESSFLPAQPDNLTSSTYLASLEPLSLPSGNTDAITLSCSNGKWSYKKGESGASTRFTGTVKMGQGVATSTNKLVIATVTGNPTLTFEKVEIKPTDGATLTIDEGCALTIHTTGDKTSTLTSSAASTLVNKGSLTLTGKGLYIGNTSATDTHYGLDNSGTFTVSDPSSTSVTFHCANTAIHNTGTLANAWMEWQFAAELGQSDSKIAFAATDDANQSPTALLLQGKTYATTVTPGKTYRLWTVTSADGEVRTRQQGKTAGATPVPIVYFPSPAENGVTAFTGVKVAIPVTVIQPTTGGGTISVFSGDSLLAKADTIPNGVKLTLKSYPLPGYELETLTINSAGNPNPPSKYTVPDDATAVTITAAFKAKGNAALADTTQADIVDNVNNLPETPVEKPTAVISKGNTTASDNADSEVKLITGALEPEHKESVKDTLGKIAAGISERNIIFAEIALVEITTTSGSGGTQTTMTPIQPKDGHTVHVVYPYPSGANSNDSFVIVHLKTDGTMEVYRDAPDTSKGEMKLDKTARGLEFDVDSFSPFGIAWTKAEPDNPDPTPDPTPVYYTVSLPAVEGATTDPAAGNYEVEAWDTFRFYLTLDKAYDQSVPVVTTDRGETITPRASDGAYLVKYIRSDVTISIIGIQKNTDVANATIEAGVKVWTEPSALCLETDRTEEVRVITVSGSTVAVFDAKPGMNRRALAPGLYIIQTPRTVCKVIVR